jgi:hypothetical protein
MLQLSYIVVICILVILLIIANTNTNTTSNNFISVNVRQEIREVDINGNLVSIIVDLDPTDMSNITDPLGNDPAVNHLGNLVLNEIGSFNSFKIDRYGIGSNRVIKDSTGTDIIATPDNINKYIRSDDKTVIQSVSVLGVDGSSEVKKININVNNINAVAPNVIIDINGNIIVERTPGSNLSLQDEYDYIYYFIINKSSDGKIIHVKTVPRRLYCMSNKTSENCVYFKNDYCLDPENSVNSTLCTNNNFSALY